MSLEWDPCQKKTDSCEGVDDDGPRYIIILIILYRVCSFIDKQISYYYFLNYLYLMVLGRVLISTVPLLLDFIDSFRVILVLFFICIIAKYWSTTFGIQTCASLIDIDLYPFRSRAVYKGILMNLDRPSLFDYIGLEMDC